jgi:hypothetical protein
MQARRRLRAWVPRHRRSGCRGDQSNAPAFAICPTGPSPAAKRRAPSVREPCSSAEGGAGASWIRANADRPFGRKGALSATTRRDRGVRPVIVQLDNADTDDRDVRNRDDAQPHWSTSTRSATNSPSRPHESRRRPRAADDATISPSRPARAPAQTSARPRACHAKPGVQTRRRDPFPARTSPDGPAADPRISV